MAYHNTDRIVFIIGAGASYDAKIPLMANFLEIAYDIGRHHGLSDDQKASFKRVHAVTQALNKQRGYADLDSDNLESVFTAVEMGQLLGRLSDLPEEDVASASEDLRSVIATTIEQRTNYYGVGGVLAPPWPYGPFARLIAHLQKRHRVSILSFNYDLALDIALRWADVPYHYGFGTPNDDAIQYLKLHGSLNWLLCPACDELNSWDVQLMMGSRFGNKSLNAENIQVEHHLLPHIQAPALACECGSHVKLDPFLVPPTWNKAQYQQSVVSLWRDASQKLAQAEHIVVIGYSLPDTDTFFQQLIALSLTGEARLKGFHVINPDNAVKDRFKKILGPATVARFKFHGQTFRNGIGDLVRLFNVPSDIWD